MSSSSAAAAAAAMPALDPKASDQVPPCAEAEEPGHPSLLVDAAPTSASPSSSSRSSTPLGISSRESLSSTTQTNMFGLPGSPSATNKNPLQITPSPGRFAFHRFSRPLTTTSVPPPRPLTNRTLTAWDASTGFKDVVCVSDLVPRFGWPEEFHSFGKRGVSLNVMMEGIDPTPPLISESAAATDLSGVVNEEIPAHQKPVIWAHRRLRESVAKAVGVEPQELKCYTCGDPRQDCRELEFWWDHNEKSPALPKLSSYSLSHHCLATPSVPVPLADLQRIAQPDSAASRTSQCWLPCPFSVIGGADNLPFFEPADHDLDPWLSVIVGLLESVVDDSRQPLEIRFSAAVRVFHLCEHAPSFVDDPAAAVDLPGTASLLRRALELLDATHPDSALRSDRWRFVEDLRGLVALYEAPPDSATRDDLNSMTVDPDNQCISSVAAAPTAEVAIYADSVTRVCAGTTDSATEAKEWTARGQEDLRDSANDTASTTPFPMSVLSLLNESPLVEMFARAASVHLTIKNISQDVARAIEEHLCEDPAAASALIRFVSHKLRLNADAEILCCVSGIPSIVSAPATGLHHVPFSLSVYSVSPKLSTDRSYNIANAFFSWGCQLQETLFRGGFRFQFVAVPEPDDDDEGIRLTRLIRALLKKEGQPDAKAKAHHWAKVVSKQLEICISGQQFFWKRLPDEVVCHLGPQPAVTYFFMFVWQSPLDHPNRRFHMLLDKTLCHFMKTVVPQASFTKTQLVAPVSRTTALIAEINPNLAD